MDIELNKTGEKGNFKYPIYPGLYEMIPNPFVERTDWDWDIDPVCLRYTMRYVWDHYHLPMMITENGFGAHESIGPDGKIHDEARIKFLNDHIYQLGLAIEDGCDVISFNLWSFTDLLSTGNGMEKRYGLVYVDVTDDQLNNAKSLDELSLKRIPKDSFDWYSKVIATNGACLKGPEGE